jgi:hypothetical protein
MVKGNLPAALAKQPTLRVKKTIEYKIQPGGVQGSYEPCERHAPINGVASDLKEYCERMLNDLRDQCKATMTASADVFQANMKLYVKVVTYQADLKAMTSIDKSKLQKKRK